MNRPGQSPAAFPGLALLAGALLAGALLLVTPASLARQSTPAHSPAPPPSHPLVQAARSQVGVTVVYDPAYVRLDYPGGDVPIARGVCTDVVVRALRSQGVDLQQRIHQDKRAHPSAYPARWRHLPADAHIDHRRVPNQMTWFTRQGWSRAATRERADYLPGDIVAWDLGGGLLHIGIVSDRKQADGTPLILHNIARGTREEDLLLKYRIIGHYRRPAEAR